MLCFILLFPTVIISLSASYSINNFKYYLKCVPDSDRKLSLGVKCSATCIPIKHLFRTNGTVFLEQ